MLACTIYQPVFGFISQTCPTLPKKFIQVYNECQKWYYMYLQYMMLLITDTLLLTLIVKLEQITTAKGKQNQSVYLV